MKYLMILSLVLGLGSFAGVREVTLKTEKQADGVHWMPEKVEVFPGEMVKFVIKHDLPEGFEFHGFFIPQLKIQKEVHRNKTEEMMVQVPGDLKPGEYPIGCHLHPTHKPATLVVKAAPSKKG